jgi:ssDNA-binding Zn-finger/Zn-ribbon topoisomerase 1
MAGKRNRQKNTAMMRRPSEVPSIDPETIKLHESSSLICPECSAEMVLRDSRYGKFYGCSRFPKCRGTHTAHVDGRPMGVPGDVATRQARQRAHEVLYKLCGERRLSTEQGYQLVCLEMHMSRDEAHIGLFSKQQCEELIGKLEHLLVQRNESHSAEFSERRREQQLVRQRSPVGKRKQRGNARSRPPGDRSSMN